MSTGSIEEKIIQRQLSKEGLQSIVDNKEEVRGCVCVWCVCVCVYVYVCVCVCVYVYVCLSRRDTCSGGS